MVSANQSPRPQLDADVTDYYRLLGVPYSATFQEISRAYREAMKRAHPDRHRPERRAAAEERAKELNAAFATLSKADSRREYDTKIRATAVQEQVMNRYFGGFAVPGDAADPLGQRLRREQTVHEKRDKRRADHSAIGTILFVFGAIAVAAVALLVILTVIGWVVSRVF